MCVICCCLCHAVVSDSFCNRMDCSPPGSSVHGISIILEWVAISTSRGSSWPRGWVGIFRKSPTLQADSWPLSHQGSPCVSLWSVKKWVTGLICKQMKMSSFWTHVDPGHQAVGLTWRGPQSSPGASPGQRTFWQRRRLHQPCVYGWQFTWFSVVFYLLS